MEVTVSLEDARKVIEERWRSRVDAQGYPGTRARLAAQAEFFAGAMSMLSALGYSDGESMPPKWVMPILTSRCVLGDDLPPDRCDYDDKEDEDYDDE